MSKKKIMIFTMPHSGHLNPLWPILKEILKTGDYEITIFLDENHKEKVESLGAKFKPVINNYEQFEKIHEGKSEVSIAHVMSSFYDVTKDNVDYFANEIDKEKPDLIIYDFLCMPFKWTARYYNHYYNLSKSLSPEKADKLKFKPKNPLPECVCFSPSFGVYGNAMPLKLNFWSILKLIFLQILFRFTFGFKMMEKSPLVHAEFVKKIFYCIVPDVQPKAHLFDQKRFRFLGSTVNENFSDPKANEDPFKSLLKDNDSKLIFASLGTIFNNSVEAYKKIIDAFVTFDEEPVESKHPSLKLKDFKIVVSLGEFTLNKINEMIKNGTYSVPENIILVKTAPQIDILKKASLFITHGGMNSASESIHFAVPMILIPMAADQPFVAGRIADDLGLGIKLDKNTLTSEQIRSAAHKILSDKSYLTRVKRYSDISRTFNGVENIKNEIIEFIEKKKV